MYTALFLILSFVALLGTFLFMLSTSEMKKLNDVLNKSVGDLMFQNLENVFNKNYNLDDKVLKYRQGLAICLFLVSIFFLLTGLYFIR